MKQKIFNKNTDLERAYYNRVRRDTKLHNPPTMTLIEFINAWRSEPRKLLFRSNKDDGYMMMLVDFDRPLAVDNYQIIKRCDYTYHLFGSGLEQNALKERLSVALSNHKKNETYKEG